MLLAVTPSILARLGISLSSLADFGVATLSQTGCNSNCNQVKVVTLTASVDEIGDLNRELLTAEAMAQRMQCSRANVYDREKKGTLFSVLPPGRENGRRYPAFQLHPRLDGVLLNELIAKFRELEASTNLLWDFVRSVHESLGGLTGVELLTGQHPTRIGVNVAVITELTTLSAERRRAYVVEHALEGLNYASQ
jgi:hypothetical protein